MLIPVIMLRSSIGILVLIQCLPAIGCQAQVKHAEEQIKGAVLPAPEELREGARVYGYAEDGSLVSLREGANALTCLADKPGDEQFHAACYHNALEPYMARGRELRADGIDGQESLRIRHEEAEAGKLAMPDQPAAVYNLMAPLDTFDPAKTRVGLYAVYIPYATQASTGIPEQPVAPGAPWIMRAGTPSAHIMIAPAQ